MKNKYSHAIALSILGAMFLMITFPGPMVLYRFFGGVLIGTAILLAKEHGKSQK